MKKLAAALGLVTALGAGAAHADGINGYVCEVEPRSNVGRIEINTYLAPSADCSGGWTGPYRICSPEQPSIACNGVTVPLAVVLSWQEKLIDAAHRHQPVAFVTNKFGWLNHFSFRVAQP